MPYTKTETSQPVSWYGSWAEVKVAEESYYNLTPISGDGALKQHDSDDDLTSDDSSTWPDGYWGNMMPALAYAVQHGASGAAAGLARLTVAPAWACTNN